MIGEIWLIRRYFLAKFFKVLLRAAEWRVRAIAKYRPQQRDSLSWRLPKLKN